MDTHLFVCSQAGYYFFRSANHGSFTKRFRQQRWTFIKVFDGFWTEESVCRCRVIGTPGCESTEIFADCLSTCTPAFRFGLWVDVSVAQNHEFWVVSCLWVVGHGTVEFTFQVNDFIVVIHQWCDHNVAAVSNGEVMRIGVSCSNPHRRVWLLNGFLHRSLSWVLSV